MNGTRFRVRLAAFVAALAAAGGWVSMSRDGVARTSAHTISVRVNADASRLESVIATIDFAALAKLVPK